MIRIVFLVSHLSGTGHLVRTLAIARAARLAGATVTVLSGGRPLEHLATGDIDLVQLPWIAVRGRDFASPLGPDGRPADETLHAHRRDVIAATIAARRPHVLVTETWPLGRRRLSAEYEAAIAAAKAANPVVRVAASVRDLPEPPSKPARLAEAAARLAALVDCLLVHGDPDFLALDASWPLPADLAPRPHYTGYVAPPSVAALPSEEVVVSVGGGDLGGALLEIAAAASARSGRPWRLRTGGPEAAALAADLSTRHGHDSLIVEPAAADWRARLAGAAAAVTLAGYNAVIDLAQCNTPALLVPDTTGGEREQALRAAALSRRGGIAVGHVETLTPDILAAQVETLASGPRRPSLGLTLDGAKRSAQALLALAEARVP
ncbi:MAG: glycosyltransferase [Pseudomonadota bacterium]